VFQDVDLLAVLQYEMKVALSRADEILPLYERYVQLYDSPDFALIGKSLFLYVLFSFLQDAFVADFVEMKSYHVVFRFLTFLEYHAFQETVLDDFFEQSPYSADYTVQLFKQYVGTTPHMYVRDRRMRKAEDLLLQGYSVKEAAYECLFKDEFYFSRCFKKNAGVSPRAFRQRVLNGQ
jgi:AraC-like DNA-binding protein